MPHTFAQLMKEAQHAGRRLAAESMQSLVVTPFGTTDRQRCRDDNAAFCGVWVYAPGHHGRLELWLCEDRFGEMFASDDIGKAKPFPRYPTASLRAEARRQTNQFANEVRKQFEADAQKA